jgi:hypothetical protein
MSFDTEEEYDEGIDFDAMKNEFTGSQRESLDPPGHDEPICLISYEITFILLGDGPKARPSFWKMYRRELALNRKTQYRNYHVSVCRHQLVSLRRHLGQPVYYRNHRLTTEKQLDASSVKVLADPRFN